MDVFERIELRRFVGRELLLWLWFESEVFEATLSTKTHGSFGMWIEGRLVLSAGQEVPMVIEPKCAQSHWACSPAKVRRRK